MKGRQIEFGSFGTAGAIQYVLMSNGQVTVAAVDRGSFRDAVHAWADAIVDLHFGDLDDAYPELKPR